MINFIFSNEILKRNRNAKKWWPYLCKFDKNPYQRKLILLLFGLWMSCIWRTILLWKSFFVWYWTHYNLNRNTVLKWRTVWDKLLVLDSSFSDQLALQSTMHCLLVAYGKFFSSFQISYRGSLHVQNKVYKFMVIRPIFALHDLSWSKNHYNYPYMYINSC